MGGFKGPPIGSKHIINLYNIYRIYYIHRIYYIYCHLIVEQLNDFTLSHGIYYYRVKILIRKDIDILVFQMSEMHNVGWKFEYDPNAHIQPELKFKNSLI